jgi:hypothetical protein
MQIAKIIELSFNITIHQKVYKTHIVIYNQDIMKKEYRIIFKSTAISVESDLEKPIILSYFWYHSFEIINNVRGFCKT